MSTCQAGIGGPLVTLDGDVIGMNFYDKRIGTPFLLLVDIYKILASFEIKRYSSAYHISSFLNNSSSWLEHNLIIGMFASELGEVGNDRHPPGAPFWKMDEDDNNKLNRLVF